MKIIHVINSLATGGAERMVIELAIHGRQQGHQVKIVALQDLEGVPRQIARQQQLDLTVIGNSLWDPRIYSRLRHATENADIVHVHLFPAMYWAAFLDTPKVFTEHSTNNNRVGKPFYQLFERWVYDRYDRIIAIGTAVQKRFTGHAQAIRSSTLVSTAQNGIADRFFSDIRTQRSELRRILSIGSLTPVKNHQLAIETMSLLPTLSLDIAGEGPLRAELESQIKKLEISDRVRLLGDVVDVPKLLLEYDLLLSTSKFEGFGLVAAEAQAMGIPVVGPAVDGFSEVVLSDRSGILFTEAKAAIVADCVQKALKEPTYSSLVVGATKNAKRFNMEASFKANFEIYEEVLRENQINFTKF